MSQPGRWAFLCQSQNCSLTGIRGRASWNVVRPLPPRTSQRAGVFQQMHWQKDAGQARKGKQYTFACCLTRRSSHVQQCGSDDGGHAESSQKSAFWGPRLVWPPLAHLCLQLTHICSALAALCAAKSILHAAHATASWRHRAIRCLAQASCSHSQVPPSRSSWEMQCQTRTALTCLVKMMSHMSRTNRETRGFPLSLPASPLG